MSISPQKAISQRDADHQNHQSYSKRQSTRIMSGQVSFHIVPFHIPTPQLNSTCFRFPLKLLDA